MTASCSVLQQYLAEAEQTRAAGAALGRALSACVVPVMQQMPLVFTLSGELGAGKTTYVSGLLAALGVPGPVRSPTYTLIEPYELASARSADSAASFGTALGKLGALHTVYHLDLYRLTDPLQLEDLGIRDLLQPGALLLVEWAERAGNLWSQPDLAINLRYPEAVTATGRWLSYQLHRDALRPLIASLGCSVD